MHWIDALIIFVPLAFVLYMGFNSRKYIRDTADFLAAGRVAGRYVICVADVANGIAVIALISFVEQRYRTGFSVGFWAAVMVPVNLFLALTGFCIYRWRETKAMSLGQFLEMRYSRSFRIFAAGLRSISEMIANMIMPAIAARFFIYFFDLPKEIEIFGIQIQTFLLLIIGTLTIAISIICFGGTLALIITDTIQGLICYPVMVVFAIFVLVKFSWFNEIVPVMHDRVAGESFLNPFDVHKLRDFNLFATFVVIFGSIINRASWIGAGNSSAAKSPHEQKMAGLLGTWRNGFAGILYMLLAIVVIVLLNHKTFTNEGTAVRQSLTTKIAKEMDIDQQTRTTLTKRLMEVPPHNHTIGVDKPLSQENNLDNPYFDAAEKTLANSGEGKAKFQEFRTLYNQLMLPVTMRHLLPTGLMGMFCLLIVMMMISTDDSRILSASLTFSQDVIMPLKKKPFTPKQHIWLLRWVSIGVGVFFAFGSTFMAQLDYIQMFVTIVCSMWLGGAGPVMIFGLYSRFGTTAGAYACLLTGMFLSLGSILVQRNWADHVYPWLAENNYVEPVANALEKISAPFNPIVVWKMDDVKCPVNSYEFYFMTIVIGIVVYYVVSKLTCKKPFNLDRMLHRGKYCLDHDKHLGMTWTKKNFFSNIIGINKDYTRGDKVIAWSIFIYTMGYGFLVFLVVAVWNSFFGIWPKDWWANFYFITMLIVPCIIAAISTVWFSIGGFIDLRRLFRDLKLRKANALDDGRVEGHMSLADKAELEAMDEKNGGEN